MATLTFRPSPHLRQLLIRRGFIASDVELVRVRAGERLGYVPTPLLGNVRAQALFEAGLRITTALHAPGHWIDGEVQDGQETE